jgi:hypothetical protein
LKIVINFFFFVSKHSLGFLIGKRPLFYSIFIHHKTTSALSKF